MTLLDWHRRRRDARRADLADIAVADALRWAFRDACVGAGVAQRVDAPVAGSTMRAPEVAAVAVGPPVRFTVRMLPGQVPAALARAGGLIAPHVGGIALRVVDRGHGWAMVTVLDTDPLAPAVTVPGPGRGSVVTLLGHDEHAQPVHLDWTTAAHLVLQGSSRSGKSVCLYSTLAQLAERPDVTVSGADPTGLLLGPWTPRSGTVPPSVGGHDPGAHLAVLDALTAEMDRRIGSIPAGRDTVDVGPDHPLLVVILEEYPGLLRLVDGVSAAAGKRARAAVGRLVGEGAKAGLRVVLVAQRAEAKIIGGYEREQASHVLSFRVSSRESVALLHPDAPPDVIAAHAVAPAGVALLSAPGVPLRRFRVPNVTYPAYVQAVAGRSAA